MVGTLVLRRHVRTHASNASTNNINAVQTPIHSLFKQNMLCSYMWGRPCLPLLSPDVEKRVKMQGITPHTGEKPDVRVEFLRISYSSVWFPIFTYIFVYFPVGHFDHFRTERRCPRNTSFDEWWREHPRIELMSVKSMYHEGYNTWIFCTVFLSWCGATREAEAKLLCTA